MKQQAAQRRIIPPGQLEAIFHRLPDGVVVCDREGKILRINAAALKLFEVDSDLFCIDIPYRQFLQAYLLDHDQQQQALSLDPWLMNLLTDAEPATNGQQKAIVVLQGPSGRKSYVNIGSFFVGDAQQHAAVTVYVFHDITHRYQKALHLQRVYEAVLSLREAIAHIPEDDIDFTFPQGIFLLSPPVLFVAQQLVEVIHEILDCQYVNLLALGPRGGHLHYAVGSGFTSQQEQYHHKMLGCFLPSDFVDETVLDRLSAGQEVMLPANQVHLPPGFREDLGNSYLLMIPLFLANRLSGALVIAKPGLDNQYTPQEVELVKAVATETMLVIEYLHTFYAQTETRVKALAQQEMHRSINDFLNLASHELNTPLTVVKGNIQLAQHRLMTLKRQLTTQPKQASEQIERIQHPLASAASSTRLMERIIKDLIDDARIQTNTLELHLQRCDLIALLKEAVNHQQRLAPEHRIVLNLRSQEKVVPVIADAERIKQVINGYLANALRYSPADQPVTVQLTVEDKVARVSVHDEGPGVPCEEQERIWERFYYAAGITALHAPAPSVGLGLYLIQAIIERHHGSVGVQSEPGHGATFWYTLPVEASAPQ